jgi:hypothetical protein
MVKLVIIAVSAVVITLFCIGVYTMLVVNRWARDYLAPTRNRRER